MHASLARFLGALPAAGLVAFLVAAPLADDATGQCAFSGLSATSFGTGTGVCSTSTLAAELDTGACTLRLFYAQDPFWCGNTYLTHHLLIVGSQDIPGGIPVDRTSSPEADCTCCPSWWPDRFPERGQSSRCRTCPA